MKIFTIFERSKTPTGTTTHYQKEDGKDAKKITIDKWFRLYDKGTEVMPPLTID